MVQCQLCTLDHLMESGFGRPFPRHGLQLLFWFANHCVTFELVHSVSIMKLVSACEPESGHFGFHLFGNIEELLPVLRRRNKKKRQVVYFVVGNLNTETYPASANLPAYVRENYGAYGDYNIDRIIISYHVQTRVVETLYVTEHDGAAYGRFRHDRTYDISSELVRTLQSTQLDVSNFLTWMGYYGDTQMVPNTETTTYYPESSVQTYSGYTASRPQSIEFRYFTYAEHINRNYYNYHQNVHDVYYLEGLVDRKYHGAWRETPSYWPSCWESYKRAFEEAKKRGGGGGGGPSFFKLLLGAAVLYLAAKCVSWCLRGCWEDDGQEAILHRIPWRSPWSPQRSPCLQRPHVMLDYVY
ncbi:uncharacterized protein LOC114434130 [Parambassis ranga]|uniref:Uncharacterized protein LOC114434130 n=1 Tax=Parambassis ranga TaxID=210632 RepID=A0A6P7IEZ1_9TELE|nr:uncharacterized protein LOC114434130 [Parambassis ranga]